MCRGKDVAGLITHSDHLYAWFPHHEIKGKDNTRITACIKNGKVVFDNLVLMREKSKIRHKPEASTRCIFICV